MDRTYDRLESKINGIPFGLFALTIVSLPFCSFLFCIVWSILYFFDRATSTHCEVANYLPSISAAIGNYQPQCFIWQISILLQFLPRLLIAKYYLNYFQDTVLKSSLSMTYVVCLFNIVENFALVGLSMWTSSDNYELHKMSFITFIICSELYMVFSYRLFKIGPRQNVPLGRIEKKSLGVKLCLCTVNITCILLAVYFFYRHNTYCEPGVYTLFALMEYIVVLTNMGYHMTAYWDFTDKLISFSWSSGISIQSNAVVKYNRLI